MRISWFTVLKACERSMATTTVYYVHCAGFCLLIPLVTWSEISSRAVAVECSFLKPCWWGARLMAALGVWFQAVLLLDRVVRLVCSWVLGLLVLFGLSRGIILPTFHISGELTLFTALLKIFVRYSIPLGSRCFTSLGIYHQGHWLWNFSSSLWSVLLWLED